MLEVSFLAISSSNEFLGKSWNEAVSIGPGHTALTDTPVLSKWYCDWNKKFKNKKKIKLL